MLCRHILIPPRLVDYVLYVVLLFHVDYGVAGARRSHNECSKERYQKHSESCERSRKAAEVQQTSLSKTDKLGFPLQPHVSPHQGHLSAHEEELS